MYNRSVNSVNCNVSVVRIWFLKRQESGNWSLSLSEWEKRKRCAAEVCARVNYTTYIKYTLYINYTGEFPML